MVPLAEHFNPEFHRCHKDYVFLWYLGLHLSVCLVANLRKRICTDFDDIFRVSQKCHQLIIDFVSDLDHCLLKLYITARKGHFSTVLTSQRMPMMSDREYRRKL